MQEIPRHRLKNDRVALTAPPRRRRPVLMLMVDGFGLPPQGLADSVYARFAPKEFCRRLATATPVDATMGVPGAPQSATGQTALFTGVNAAQLMGRHQPGFPGPSLRRLLEQDSLFAHLRQAGQTVAFANAYVRFSLEELTKLRLCSATTVMTQAALGAVRGREELLAGQAVYHDLTRRTLAEVKPIPLCSPRQAAHHLLDLATNHDFTLFEYFLTDHAGHRQDETALAQVLAELGEFCCELFETPAQRCTILLTSDHGNCEDLSASSHTCNPVPLLLNWSTSNLPIPEKIEEICKFVEQSLCQISAPITNCPHFATEEP